MNSDIDDDDKWFEIGFEQAKEESFMRDFYMNDPVTAILSKPDPDVYGVVTSIQWG